MVRTKKKPVKPTPLNSLDENTQSSISDLELILNYINLDEPQGNGKSHQKQSQSPPPTKSYKSINEDNKDKIVRYTSELIITNYFKNHSFKSQIHKFCLLFGMEKDWEHMNMLLDCLSVGSINIDLLTQLSKSAFSIIDEELSYENTSTFVIGSCLALLTEIALRVKKSAEKFDASAKLKAMFFIEFITSNMLARSNVNNETMRIGLVYYFTHIEPMSHINTQKILSRFGQSLLEHVLDTYFCNSKKSDLAFFFIIDHLDEFIFSSPALAEMSNSVLQNQMLKHPQEFPLLMKKYISYKLKNIEYNAAQSLIVHLSFLLKEACEINQKILIESMLEMSFNFIYSFEDKSKEAMLNLYEVLGEIISTSKSVKAKEISSIIYDKILSNRKVLDSTSAYKLIHVDAKSSNIYNKLKNQLDSSKKPTPLEEILLLAG